MLAYEEIGAKLLLYLLQMAGEDRLGHIKLLRGSRKGAFLRDDQYIFKRLSIHINLSIEIINSQKLVIYRIQRLTVYLLDLIQCLLAAHQIDHIPLGLAEGMLLGTDYIDI